MDGQKADPITTDEPLPETAGVSPVRATERHGDIDSDAPLAEDGSLFEDVGALISDGKTYLDAELQYQKTRARYAGKHSGRAAIFALAGVLCLFFALIGLTVGGVLLLIPRIGAIAATALVVCVWLILGAICGFIAGGHAGRVSRALGENKP